ncbi:MAG: RecX family transcriptional regulator [bacterium]|nr:MAG: RecX family transcriptional regulator [bacterium]
MQVITSIELQKSKKRVNIFLDEKFGFGIDLEGFIKFNLKVNQELSNEQISIIKDKSERSKTLNKVLNYATIRPRSEKEIKDYLKRKKVEELIHLYILNKLKKLKLLDDLEFAKWWIDQRQSFSPKSKKVLTNELRVKGVNNQIIKDLLEVSEINEIKIAKNLIESKKYKWERFDKKTKKQKITQYLASKGFGWDVISKCIDINVDIDSE